MAEFTMPSLGADMDQGTVVGWLVGVGDHVTRGQVVAEVDTEKSVIEVEVFTTGTVEEILVAEGERVPVGTPLARITEDAARPAADAPPAPTAPAATARAATTSTAPVAATPTAAPAASQAAATATPAARAAATQAAPTATPTARAAATPGQAPASPLARRRAAELGVDLARVTGTGPAGAVTARDVEQAVFGGPGEPPVEAPRTAPAAAPATARVAEPLSGQDRRDAVRRAVAAAMTRSKREIPHYYLGADLDVTRAATWLTTYNEARSVTDRLLPVVPLLKASALALREVPDLNGLWVDDAFRRSDAVHLGVAIALRGGGLVAPAIHDADTLSLADLMAALRDLVGRARAGRVRATEMAEPTITVTSLGDQGADTVLPVIYPPQVAIVGFGRLRERPWVVDGEVTVRTVVTATIAGDHRVSDGHRGALLLTALDRLLQEPEAL